jgi:hypothetical protein
MKLRTEVIQDPIRASQWRTPPPLKLCCVMSVPSNDIDEGAKRSAERHRSAASQTNGGIAR